MLAQNPRQSFPMALEPGAYKVSPVILGNCSLQAEPHPGGDDPALPPHGQAASAPLTGARTKPASRASPGQLVGTQHSHCRPSGLSLFHPLPAPQSRHFADNPQLLWFLFSVLVLTHLNLKKFFFIAILVGVLRE